MLWILLWTVLVAGALLTWFLLGHQLWRKSAALGREVALVDERRHTLERANAELSRRSAGAESAVEDRPRGTPGTPADGRAAFDAPRRGRRRHYAASRR